MLLSMAKAPPKLNGWKVVLGEVKTSGVGSSLSVWGRNSNVPCAGGFSTRVDGSRLDVFGVWKSESVGTPEDFSNSEKTVRRQVICQV